MRRQRMLTFLMLLASVATLPVVARADALAELDACTLRLVPEFDVGFERIASRCPALARDLQTSDWAAWLPEGWNTADHSLSAPSLAALHMLVVRERDLRSTNNEPRVAALWPILAKLAAPERPPQGWWARLQKWLRAVLARSEQEPGSSSWGPLLGRVSLSQAVLQIVSYATLLCVLLLAGFIVVNEWRVTRMHKRPMRAAAVAARSAPAGEPLSWDVIERAALAERPRLLLLLLAARLTAARRLPLAAALTARELARAAQLPDVEDQKRLAEVAAASERLRFSKHAPLPVSLVAVLQRGRELLERLNAAESRT
jgi:hypothetical protein